MNNTSRMNMEEWTNFQKQFDDSWLTRVYHLWAYTDVRYCDFLFLSLMGGEL